MPIGIPYIDVIDFDIPGWHTAGDTIEKLARGVLRVFDQSHCITCLKSPEREL